MRSSLHEKTAIAKEKIRTERNATDEADTTWEKIVEDFISEVHKTADKGEAKYYMEMQDSKQQVILKVAVEVKEKLGDVLVITSPRGIEANWEEAV